MANKQLTARVKLNTTQAEQKLRNISKAIDAINRAAGKQTNTYAQVNSALNKTVKVSAKVKSKTDETTRSTKQWSNALSAVNSKLNGSSLSLGVIGGKLKALASTYLGLMGTKAIIGTADTITSAENKLNYVNAQSLGASGKNADGSYTQAAFNATQDSMNKMYASAQKVRMGYEDMMNNVSKSMVLAGDAFDNNTDKAIRFQEIMAEAYAVGGASQQEMSSSMYQMIQALGSGTLAGDELRSVREGAPLAYQAIEKFAQGVYDCSDSLKDMASDGMISSEMVVAAIMNAGNEMDAAFAQTKIRFDQVWTQIKNAATKAFSPVAKMLSEQLTKAVDSGLVQKVTSAFNTIAKVIMIAFTIIKNVIVWIANNWDWLQHVVIAGIMLMITYYLIKMGIAIYCAYQEIKAWIIANATMLTTLAVIAIIIMAIMGLIYVFYLWKTGAIDTCTAILSALSIIAIAIILIGILTGNMAMICVGIIIGAIVLIANSSSNLCEFIYNIAWGLAQAICVVLGVVLLVYLATGAVMLSIPVLIGLLVVGIIALLLAVFIKFTGQIIGFVYGIGYSIQAICKWIDVAWQNMCNSMGAWFWGAIADMLEGCEWLLKGINKIREALGKDAISIEGVRAKADSYKKKTGKELPSIGDAWNTGYAKGFAIGEGIQNKINGFGDKIKNLGSQYQGVGDGQSSLIDNLGNKLGLDFSKYGDGVIDPNDPAYDLSGLDDVGNGVGKIGDDTGKIADSMDLTEEDLKYLRQLAEMEWKKEYTTANITVDMTNNNNINGESDLDGIVTKLSDKLYEELNIVANGVYA